MLRPPLPHSSLQAAGDATPADGEAQLSIITFIAHPADDHHAVARAFHIPLFKPVPGAAMPPVLEALSRLASLSTAPLPAEAWARLLISPIEVPGQQGPADLTPPPGVTAFGMTCGVPYDFWSRMGTSTGVQNKGGLLIASPFTPTGLQSGRKEKSLAMLCDA